MDIHSWLYLVVWRKMNGQKCPSSTAILQNNYNSDGVSASVSEERGERREEALGRSGPSREAGVAWV